MQNRRSRSTVETTAIVACSRCYPGEEPEGMLTCRGANNKSGLVPSSGRYWDVVHILRVCSVCPKAEFTTHLMEVG